MTDAAPVEFIGKNDLFVEVTCGSIKHKTNTQQNIGANAVWELGQQVAGSFMVHDVTTVRLELKLWDENTARSNTLIGTIGYTPQPTAGAAAKRHIHSIHIHI